MKAALADRGSIQHASAHHAPAYRGFHSFCQATKAPQASRTAAWNLTLTASLLTQGFEDYRGFQVCQLSLVHGDLVDLVDFVDLVGLFDVVTMS